MKRGGGCPSPRQAWPAVPSFSSQRLAITCAVTTANGVLENCTKKSPDSLVASKSSPGSSGRVEPGFQTACPCCTRQPGAICWADKWNPRGQFYSVAKHLLKRIRCLSAETPDRYRANAHNLFPSVGQTTAPAHWPGRQSHRPARPTTDAAAPLTKTIPNWGWFFKHLIVSGLRGKTLRSGFWGEYRKGVQQRLNLRHPESSPCRKTA